MFNQILHGPSMGPLQNLRQDGKRPAQTVFNGCEYRFFLWGIIPGRS